MNRLYGDVAVVVKYGDSTVLVITQRQGTIIQCRDGSLVPLTHDIVFFTVLSGPEAAWVESMDRLGLTHAVAFDYGSDAYLLHSALGHWACGEYAGDLPDQPTAKLEDDPPF